MERQRKTAKNTSHNRRGRVKESKRSKRNRFWNGMYCDSDDCKYCFDDCTESFGNDSVKISHSCSGITFFLLVYF